MRQEVWLLSEKFKVINIILFILFFLYIYIYIYQGYSSKMLPNCIQDIDNKYN
jgi:hypothetical protein